MPTLFNEETDELDLSVLDSFDNLNESQDPQEPTKKRSEKRDKLLDLSSLDDLFPKESQPLSSPPSKITSKFGNRKDPFTGAKKFHNGVDIPMSLNTPINSLGKGTVIEVGDNGDKSYGKFVKVDYGGGLELTYAHLNKAAVEVGDRISSEAIIGLSGSTGRSKSPHLHIKSTLNGKPVNPENYFGSIHDVAIGALTSDDVVNDAKLDLSVLDNLNEDTNFGKLLNEADEEKLDLSPVDQIGEFAVKPLDKFEYKDERSTAEKIASGAASVTQPNIKAPNPHELIGATISTSINQTKKPNRNQVVDYWLGAVDPSYAQLNNEYRSNSAFKSNLIDLPEEAITWSNGKWNVKARLSNSARRLINAYVEGRKGGVQNGLESVYLEQQTIKREEEKFRDELVETKKQNINIMAEKHPYIKAFFNIVSPTTMLLDTDAVKSGIANAGMLDAQMVHNLRMLPEALYTLNVYGGDSEEYQNLIDKDKEIQKNLFGYQSEIDQPETTSGKIVAGAITGAMQFPKYATVGRLGLGALPTLAYVENMHRGNRDAVLAALPMALMVGGTHGLDSFFSKGSYLYVTKEINGVPQIVKTEIGRGLGNVAPFTRVKGELSLNADAQAAFLASEPISIGSISPLTRQLIMRGTNAFQNLGVGALQGEGIQDAAANFIVGLTFPVGKYRAGSFNEGKFGLIPYIPEAKPPAPKQIGTSRVEAEVPSQFWKMNGTLYLDIDTAALNLLDLKRVAKEGKLGGGSLKESMSRLMAVNDAIKILEKQIPKDVVDYFAQNENLIRGALKTNWEAIKAKEEYLGNKETTTEVKTPDEVKENPSIDLKESPIDRLNNTINRANKVKDNPAAVREAAKEVFGNIGERNKWETPDRVLFVFDKIVKQASKLTNFFKSEKGELDPNVIGDLTRIAAFHLEDFYHRRVEPSVIELTNRFKLTLGDLVNNFKPEDFQTLFQKGKEYLDSNIADPFFSRMKQDAVEKLPNRFTEEQARNILSQHKDEFEWTSGLNEFLEANKDKRISKQELVDFIQKNQVRVEESIAQEIDRGKIENLKKQSVELTKELDNYNKKVLDNTITESEWNEIARIETEIEKVHDEIDIAREGNRPRFSLEEYTGEKLELAGAKNSKEVKLISGGNRSALDEQVAFEQYLMQKYDLPFEELRGTDSYVISIEDKIKLKELTDKNTSEYKALYKSAHWDEPNVVAHYRSNDRISTDNKRVYFGEEFQSDWNHDIREAGLKLSQEEIKRQGLSQDYNIGKKEPNPFMQHNWKELVLKRFLRDAAIAKDENGNYKYDAIGWTTARQQLERYHGILEVKDFIWRKNNDGTYSFGYSDDGGMSFSWPHEVNKITLDRFAELTTPEAAQEIKDQEIKQQEDSNTKEFGGQFSLREAVELRSKEGTYADYDVAYKNILNKIGKRFGAKYSEREIITGGNQKVGFWSLGKALDLMKAGEEVVGYNKETKVWEPIDRNTESYEPYNQFAKVSDVREKIHSLEITPSMRSSLEKEGLPLYGTGGSEALKSPETGVRNRIVTADAFNSAREELVNKLSNTNKEDGGTTFNSGLNPDAFIDQVKLLYSGIKDVNEFTSALIDRYGPQIRQYAEDFYYAINQQANNFKEKLSIPLDKWSDHINKVQNSPAWQIRQGEHGAFKLRKQRIPEVEDYFKDPEKHQKPIGLDIRSWMRGVALSQISTEFAQTYDVMRSLQRVVSNYETTSLNHLKVGKGVIKSKLDAPVAEAIYQGNEWIDPTTGDRTGKVWSAAELVTNFGLNAQQIDAYTNTRAAIDNVLNLRLEGKLYAVREKAIKLTAKLATVAAGSPEELAIKTQLLDLADSQKKMIDYYDGLKSSGYITLQRTGSVAAFIEDPSLPAGHADKKIYNQFKNINQAEKWLVKQKAALGIAKDVNAGSVYDIRNLRDIILKEQLTPSQFEDLVDRSGAHTNDKEIEKLRSEVYSKFPSFTYQLKREFVRGYDRDLQTAINSTVDQLELYASSFYSKVGREEGLKQLEATGIEKTDPNLYRLSNAYIHDETEASQLNWLSKAAITARRGTYLFQLGFDVNQLWMNAVAQPITQTYGYFYRINHNGKQLIGLEPEHFFIKAAKETLNWRLGKSSTEFNDIVNRLINERVLSPEFAHTLIESQAGTRKSSKVEHWASWFMREGEKQTRLHAAAEGYFVGKEKFGLAGDDLINFITKAVDATQSNPTRGENPFVVRQLGEGGKLIYQFGAFNHMWWENLALGVKQSQGAIRKGSFLARELAPLAIIAGIGGMPLSNFAGTLYTLTTGKDPKKEWDKYLGDDTLIEQLARYGISTSASISRKLSPQVPFLDVGLQVATSPTINSVGDALSDNVPVFATGNQIVKGVSQIAKEDYLKGVINLTPRAARGPLKVLQTSREGYKAGEDTVYPRRKIRPVQKAGQFINILPTEVVEHYDRERTKRLKKVKVFKKLRKAL